MRAPYEPQNHSCVLTAAVSACRCRFEDRACAAEREMALGGCFFEGLDTLVSQISPPRYITRDFATKSSAVVFARVRAPHELKFHRSPPCAEPKCMFTLPPPPILPNYLNSHPPKSRHKGTVGETGRLPRRAASASSRADDEASAVRVVALRGLRSQVREACCCGCMATRTGAGSYRR